MTENEPGMKLATALSERADIQNRISELSERLKQNAKTQDGEKPAEEPAILLSELDRLLLRLEELVRRINDTNAKTVYEGETLSSLLARRDALKLRIRVLREFLTAASQKIDRYSQKEILIRSTVDVSAMQKQLDGYSKELRHLDDTIQGLNWTTELL